MASYKRYGSISTDDNDEEVELLPSHIGAIDARSDDDEEEEQQRPTNKTKTRWTRHHCISYSLAALIFIVSVHYWYARSLSYSDGDDDTSGVNVDDHHSSGNDKKPAAGGGRVPMPPALSDIDPTSMGFRSTTRSGLALPSKAWGEHYLNNGDEEQVFTPLPTNEWYGNLISHVAATDPSVAGEVAHVYTIPYVLGVSPPHPTKLPHPKKGSAPKVKQTMAGIDLLMPVVKAGASNIQMVFNKLNGVSLGAIVKQDESSTTDKKKKGSSSALTSYVVDPDEPISPLGVSLKWNHVNMKSHIVRGMPYGTVRFGKDAMKKSVLPTILSGNRPVSIVLDSDRKATEEEGDDASSKQMMCGSLTGEPIHQDPNHMAPISHDGKAHIYSVKRELMFHSNQSDFTWVVFFSRPVKVQCFSDAMAAISVPGPTNDVQFRLNVVEVGGGEHPDDELVVRMALLDGCTTGKSIIKEHCEHLSSLGYETITGKKKAKEYLKVLREGAMLYPKSPLVGTQFPEEEDDDSDGEGRVTNVVFDWDATSVSSKTAHVVSKVKAEASVVAASSGLRAATTLSQTKKKNDAFIMFALPHHLESLSSTAATNSEVDDSLCLHTFHGRTCLVQGSVWNLPVAHGKPQSFLADRPPLANVIPSIAEALTEDIQFELGDNILRGAADTYFSGKILAKIARIIEINEELQNLKSGEEESYKYSDADDTVIEEAKSAAAEVTLPSEEEVESLLDDLEQAVEIWLNPGGKGEGGAEAEFIYDESWGGLINCGCKYTFKKHHESSGYCNNTFPECPAIASVNEDFGNGWYNDHHFHYGYNIYAAAVVAKHRPEWGRKYYDQILLYIRDIANPSADDTYFPMWRQKDWYLGNSWAAGLMSMELSPHGREQESSSEAIAAFEGIALYGNVMMEAFAEDEENLGSARLVRNVGELLTAMEVSATNRFWHVWGSKNDQDGVTNETKATNDHHHINTYPKQYKKPVVGMMHETMASFQTWFAPEDVVSYGIQLMPFTAVSERRDDPEWSKILYPVYAKSCKTANEDNDNFCEDNGWSILQAGVLAETGEIDGALELASEVPDEVYESDGACGNSISNTLWFISTRRQS